MHDWLQLLVHAENDKETRVKQGFAHFEHDYHFFNSNKITLFK